MTGHHVLGLAPKRSAVPHEHQETGRAGAKGEGYPRSRELRKLRRGGEEGQGQEQILCYFLGGEIRFERR